MFSTFISKKSPGVSLVRRHIVTVAAALGLNACWRVPRTALQHGALPYGLALTAAMTLVGAPAALLQLAIGQLTQQDVIGMWRAVPFFTGVGYLRLLIASFCSVYTAVYLSLIAVNFFYTLNTEGHHVECAEVLLQEGKIQSINPFISWLDKIEETNTNSTVLCYTEVLMAPIGTETEFYISSSFLIIALWIMFPFLLYSPLKFLRRILYVLGPMVLLLGVVIVGLFGSTEELRVLAWRDNWRSYLRPDIWHAALAQALVSNQVASGYLVSAGDTLYSKEDFQHTTIIMVAVNIAASWLGLLFWFVVGGVGEKDTSMVTVLYQVYFLVGEKHLLRSWLLLLLFTLFISGIITMLTLLYPLYERFRRVGGARWRGLSGVSSVVGTGAALLVLLTHKMAGLHLIEDIVVPLLVSFATLLEISAFVFIYGWKVLNDDINILAGHSLSWLWTMGWCVALGILAPVFTWWVVTVGTQAQWTDAPYNTSALVATIALALLVFLSFAIVAVVKQTQFNILGKLKSSFKPSRRWGPRDPVANYYWMTQRDASSAGAFRRRSDAHTARTSTVASNPAPSRISFSNSTPLAANRRASSDDWMHTVFRKNHIINHKNITKKRSQSFNMDNHRRFLNIIEDLQVSGKERKRVTASDILYKPRK